MKYDDIKPYIEEGLVSEQEHPEAPAVRIFNYTQKCQFEQAWDDVTRQCRGLILNVETGEVIARPFPKFFNYGEHVSKGWAIPTTHPVVMEKLDGSLGILYRLNDKPWIATRGSFTSEQAIWATKWWRERLAMLPPDGYTELFEIIYPENRIVVNYDFSGLVHLATIVTATGVQVQNPPTWGGPVREVREVPYTDMETLQKMDEPNSEGFVLYYPDENVRMKVKFPEYVRLHKLVTGVSEIAIWEHLKEGKGVDDLVEKVPDEFYRWVKDVVRRLGGEFEKIRSAVNHYSANVIAPLVLEGASRKDIAEVIKRTEYPGLLFAALDGKDYEPMIWRMVRPHGRSSYKVDIDA